MNILHTCRNHGHRWGVAQAIPYQGRTDPGNDGWMEIQRCQRALCQRLRIVYTDGSCRTFYSNLASGPFDMTGNRPAF